MNQIISPRRGVCGYFAAVFGIALISAAVAPAQEASQTSQSSSTQLNQLFTFETTPNKSDAGEGYIDGQFRFGDFKSDMKQYYYQVQGQYSFTPQLAVGGSLPFYDTHDGGSNSGLGDLAIYGQYNLDQFINPDVVDVTVQTDIIFPTGSIHHHFDTGRFGIRPLLLAYKDFPTGPGEFGVYGLLGCTITTDSDLRIGLAGTYEYHRIYGILEFDDITGNHLNGPLVTITPGIAYAAVNPWEIAIGVPIGLNNASPQWGIQLKLTYAFQK
jgi:hypothetical protein